MSACARRCAAALSAAVLAVGAGRVQADAPAPPPWQGSVEAGLGHEANSSPLFRFSPEGELIYLPGRQRLAGAYASAAVGLQGDHALGDDWRWNPSLRLDARHAPRAQDLNLAQLGADSMWRRPVGAWVLGLGAGLQRLWVGGAPFRRAASWQADATWAAPEGRLLHVALERAQLRHPGALAELDGRATLLSINARQDVNWPGVDTLDLMVGVRREHNRHGYADLNHHAEHLRVGFEGARGDWSWDLGLMLQRARYREGLDGPEGLWPARRDRGLSLTGGLAWAFAPGWDWRLNGTWARNRAQPALYANRLRGLQLSLAGRW